MLKNKIWKLQVKLINVIIIEIVISASILALSVILMLQHFCLKLSNSEKFDEENLSLYSQFESQLLIKLEINQALIENVKKQLWYNFNKLKNKIIMNHMTHYMM